MPLPSNERPHVAQINVKINGSDLAVDIMETLIGAEVENTLGMPSMFTLRFEDDKLDAIDNTDTFKIGASAEILMADEQGTITSIMKGEIIAVEPDFPDSFVAILTVRGYDHSHRLNRETKARAFVQNTDSDIVSSIAGEIGLSAQVTSTTQVHEHVFQDHQTDLAFLHERAQRVGFELLVDDKTLYFRKPEGSRGQLTLKWGETLRSFRPRMSAARQVNEVTVKGWDVKQKQAIVGQATSSSLSPQVGEGWGGAVAQTAFSAAKHVEIRRPIASQSEADTLAQSILDQINSGFVEAEGVAYGNPNLVAGKKITLQNLATRFNGTYMVTSTRHVYEGGEYNTHFTVQGRKAQSITDIMNGGSQNGKHSSWGGVVIGIVTNNDDPDKLGRVKLKFPWIDDQLESQWARVASVGAGNQRGLLWLPEINDEVLVAFEHGDFDHPFVIGGLWNGQDKLPQDDTVQSGKVEIRVLKTRDGHVIRLTDGSNERIEIIDSKTNTSIVLDTKEKKITIMSKGDIVLDAQGNIELKAVKDVKVSGMNAKVEAQTELSLKGTNATMEGQAQVNVKGATSTVEGSGMLTLKGGIVKIN